MPKTEEQAPSTDMAVIPKRGRGLMQSLGLKLADPAEIQWEVAERLALAQTPEELFGDNGPMGLREHLNQPFMIKRVRYLPGRFEQGAGFYALINAADPDTGEALLFTSGAMNVLVQLARAEQMGWLDRPVTAREAETPTADGYKPYRLVFS